MTDEDKQNEGGGWLERAIEGGLPQVIAGAAGKAISRLIGAAVDIPAAGLEGLAQAVRDKTEARSQVTKRLAEAAGSLAVNDPEIMERALSGMLDKAYRIQKNKDAIAKVAVQDLLENPPSSESQGPSENWLAKFERFAEDASTEDIQYLFGKLLSEEVRKPGSVAPTTLNLIANLDSDTAKMIESVMPLCTTSGIAFIAAFEPPLSVAEKTFIEMAGFWSLGKTFDLATEGGIKIVGVRPNSGFGINVVEGNKVRVQAAMLSHAGRNLVSALNPEFAFQKLADHLIEISGVVEVVKGQVEESDGQVRIVEPVQLAQSRENEEDSSE